MIKIIIVAGMPYEIEFIPDETFKGYYVYNIGMSCYSYGNTLEEAETNIIEAIECYLMSLMEDMSNNIGLMKNA